MYRIFWFTDSLVSSDLSETMSSSFKTVFAVRFIGYLVFFIGLISFIFMLGPLVQAEVGYRVDRLSGVKRIVSSGPWEQPGEATDSADQDKTSSFGDISASGNQIVPVSTEFGIVIEKINANAKIIPNVNPANEQEYVTALGEGVAEALGSTPPGQPGNLYLFSHSTDAPWNIVRYNAIFYLLRELEAGDRVVIFYKNKRYDYVVFDKTITSANDVTYLTHKYEFPVLTLQTCDPPGTILNRLIVRARLVNS